MVIWFTTIPPKGRPQPHWPNLLSSSSVLIFHPNLPSVLPFSLCGRGWCSVVGKEARVAGNAFGWRPRLVGGAAQRHVIVRGDAVPATNIRRDSVNSRRDSVNIRRDSVNIRRDSGGNFRNSFLRVLYTPVKDGLHQMCGGDLTTSTYLTPHT